MAAACPAPPLDAGLVHGLLSSTDCNVRALAEGGYQALASASSPINVALTGLLTLYIGFLGYRLIVGRAPLRVGDLTVTALKIGAVLALATNWATYQTLVFDTLFRGPEQLAAYMLGSLQPEGSAFRGDPWAGLQLAYDHTQAQAAAFASRGGAGAVSPMMGGNAFGAFAMNVSGLILLITSLGVVLASKIVLGLVLALGPVFAAFLLFDTTRGLFEGWLRAAVAFAFAPLLAVMGLVAELTLLEPHIVQLAALREAGRLEMAPTMAVFMLSLVFAGVCLFAVIAGGLIATGFRMPGREAQPATERVGREPAGASEVVTLVETRSRAAQVAAAAAAQDRRELRLLEGPAGYRRQALGAAGGGDLELRPMQVEPLGRSFRRAAGPRLAASSVRRDA